MRTRRSLFLILFLFLIACGTTSQQVQREAKFKVKTTDKIEIQKSDMLLDIEKFTKALLIDEPAKDYCKSIFKKHTDIYPNPMVFEDRAFEANPPEKVAEKVSSEFGKLLEANRNSFFSVYAPPDLLLNCNSGNSLIYKSDVFKENDHVGVLNISAQFNKACSVYVKMTNRTASPTMSGISTLQLRYHKINTDQIDFTLDKFNTESKRDLGVTKTINTEEILRYLSEVFSRIDANAVKLSNSIINLVVEEIRIGLINRFVAMKEESIKTEKVYNINFDAAVSRLQRNLNHYTFDKEKSTFWFLRDKSMTYAGKNIPCKTRIDVRLFPEKNDKTAVVYVIDYGTIYDNLLKKFKYGKEQTNSELSIMIENTSFILGK